MFAAALPILGATLGGVEGYRRSGGDLGAAALAAGLGAALPGGMRMAGTALGNTALGARALGLGSQALSKGMGAAGQVASKAAGKVGIALPQGAMAPLTAAGLGAAAAGLGSFIAPSLAGQIAAGIKPPANAAVQATAGVLGTQGPGAVNYDAMGNPIPSGLGQFGNVAPYGTALDVLNPMGYGAGRTAEALREATAQRDSMRMLLPEIAQASEFRSKQELARQMAAAGIRQNIATAANMLERSQQAAQQMGLNAASQAGSALTSQYQYQ
jgi:hypothetical protein